MKTIRNGFSVITVMIIIALISLASGGIMTYYSSLNQSSAQGKIGDAARQVKEDLVAILDNDMAWYTTINHPSNNGLTDCLKTSGLFCSTPAPIAINVYNADGTLVVSTAPESGIDVTGKPCNTFVSGGGVVPCLFKYVVSWNCFGPCGTTNIGVGPGFPIVAINPKVQVTATIQVSTAYPGYPSVNRSANGPYAINITRGSVEKTLGKFCASLQGVFDGKSSCQTAFGKPGSFNCRTMTGTNGEGGPRSHFVGYKSDGTPQCADDVKDSLFCQAGSAVVGIDNTGRLICGSF